MRIWVITTSYPRHPAESINAGVLARDLALTLAEQGHDVTVVTPDKPGGVEFDSDLTGLVIPWWRPTLAMADLSGKRPADALRIVSLFLSARRALKRRGRISPPDATIALWALPSGVFARWMYRWAGAPYAVWMLGSDVWNAEKLPFGVRALSWTLDGACARYADGSDLAGEAERLTGTVAELLPSVRRLDPASAMDREVDFTFIGRYHPNKGPDLLVEAFAHVVDDNPDARLRIFGQGPLEAELVDAVRQHNLGANCSVGGPLSSRDAAAALARSRWLVIPSRIDSVPLVLSDAIQAKTGLVVTDVGDMGDIVRQYQLGHVAAAADASALAHAMVAALKTQRDIDFGAAADHFSLDRTALTLTTALRSKHTEG